jgi:hypothetical protein
MMCNRIGSPLIVIMGLDWTALFGNPAAAAGKDHGFHGI